MTYVNPKCTVKVLTPEQKLDVVVGDRYYSVSVTDLAKIMNTSTRTISRVIKNFSNVTSEVANHHDNHYERLVSRLDSDKTFSEESDNDEAEYTFKYNFILTGDTIAITKIEDISDVVVDNVCITRDHPKFDEAFTLLVSSFNKETRLVDNKIAEQVFFMLNERERIEKYTNGRVVVDFENQQLIVKSEEGNVKLPASLFDKISQTISEDGAEDKIDKYIRFAENLADNVAYNIIQRLYDFISCSSIEIDEQGFIVAYKKVRDDYTDIYTRTFDNSPGKTCSVPRNQVCDDMNQTCAEGLHVCSISYLPHYGQCVGNRVVRVKVDPRDVVAIPRDYNDSKMRCSKYTVIDDVTNEINKV